MPMTQNDMEWFAARLSLAVYDTNREFRSKLNRHQQLDSPMSLTGASQLSASIKERVAAAKKRVAQVNLGADAALTKLHSAADAAERIAVTIEKEADALLSEIGQYSNGGPPLDDEPAPAQSTPLPPLTFSTQAEPKKNESPV